MRHCFKLCLTALHNLSSHFSSVTLYPCDNDVLELFLTKSPLELIKNRRVAGNVTPFEKSTNTRKTENLVTKSKIIYFSVLFQMDLLLSLGTKVSERHTLVLNWINL